MLKKLKSLFIIEEEEKKQESTPKDLNKDKTETPPKNTSISPPAFQNVNVGNAASSKSTEKLLMAIEKNNLQGFDYLEYKTALKALDKMPMDEATKFRSAFATASTIGATLGKLVESTEYYIDVLDKEKKTFLSAFDSNYTNKITSREQEVSKVENVITNKKKQIEQLNQDIAKHQKQIDELKVKLSESKKKMDLAKGDFQNSYDYLKSQLNNDILKMKQYLK